jgi:hypothetical protein
VVRFLTFAACLLSLIVSTVVSTQAQTCQPDRAVIPVPRVSIRKLIFRNARVLSAQDQRLILKALRAEGPVGADGPQELGRRDQGLAVEDGASSVAEEAAERVRAAYQNVGYFKVQVDGKAVRVPTDSLGRYDIVVRVLSAGEQYRLGDLKIVNAVQFAAPQLGDLFPIQRGEIFSREKIAAGLEALRRLYGSQGYINYAGVPETELDDDNAVANLTINADEGKQFRLRSVEVLGVDAETKARVLSDLAMKPGDIYTAKLWVRSLLKFGDVAQHSDPNIVNKRLDERNGWVDLVLDFRKRPTCPIDLSVDSAITIR